MPRNHKLRFQIAASDGRCSAVWRVWTNGSDVYVAPRRQGGEFKISLHQSGKSRLAYSEKYAKEMYRLGTWNSDRCLESFTRPLQHAPGLTHAVCLYFPDVELRLDDGRRDDAVILKVPGPSRGGTRVVNVVFTAPGSRFTQTQPPLMETVRAEPLVSWMLPNGATLWVVHFELSGSRGLDDEADWFRKNVAKAKQLDRRSPLRLNDSSARIMISGANKQGWFCVIDAALSHTGSGAVAGSGN